MPEVSPSLPHRTGVITLRNPTWTVFYVNINGPTQHVVNPDRDGLPSVGFDRSIDGNPADSKFGFEQNRLDVDPESGGGECEPLVIDIPRWIQTALDLEILLFFRADPAKPDYLLHCGGLVIDYALARSVGVSTDAPKAAVAQLRSTDSRLASGDG